MWARVTMSSWLTHAASLRVSRFVASLRILVAIPSCSAIRFIQKQKEFTERKLSNYAEKYRFIVNDF